MLLDVFGALTRFPREDSFKYKVLDNPSYWKYNMHATCAL